MTTATKPIFNYHLTSVDGESLGIIEATSRDQAIDLGDAKYGEYKTYDAELAGFHGYTYAWETETHTGYANDDGDGNDGSYRVRRPVRSDGKRLWQNTAVGVLNDWFRDYRTESLILLAEPDNQRWGWAETKEAAEALFAAVEKL